MSALSRFLHRRRDESGFAMVVAVIVAMVSIVLVTTILAIGVHLDTQTVRERRWQLALQVAESGVERAIVALDEQAKAGLPLTFGGEGPITVPGGQFETHVTIPADLASVRVDAIGWTPSATATNRIQRRLRVVYSPEPEFRYALFSQTSLYVKSSGGIEGDVFGNEAVTLYNNTVVTGTVISGTGKVHLEQNAEVHENTATGRGGDVYSGGFDTAASPPWAVKLDNNAVVEGDVHTQVETVCSGPANYNVDNSGDLLGQVFTPGSVFGAGPAGGTVSACEPRRGKEDLPSFTFDPANYPSLVTMTVAQFNDPAYTDLAGQVWVTSAASDDSAAAIELACKQVKGDFFLYTTARINKANTCGSVDFYDPAGPSSAVIYLISENTSVNPSKPAVEVENSLELPAAPAPSPALLLYSRGFCDLKNTVVTSGAVYCNGLNIKNTLDIRYDPRVERVLGFGGVRFVRQSFVELAASTPLV